jgi:excisionase family DNA binding protein
MGDEVPEVLTKEEAAAFLRCSESTVQRLTREGALTPYRIGQRPRYPVAMLRRFAATHRLDTEPAIDMAKAPYTGPEVVTVAQACAVLGCDRRTLYTAIEQGQIAAIRLGRTIRIPKAEIERLARSRKGGVAADPAHDEIAALLALAERLQKDVRRLHDDIGRLVAALKRLEARATGDDAVG